MRLANGPFTEGQGSEAAAQRPGACGGDRRSARRWRTGLLCMGMALAAAGAYGLGWIGETPLVLWLAAIVLYARAKFGWLG